MFGGKNSFFRKPLGKNSDASKVAGAVLAPARGAIDTTSALAKGDIDKAKNYVLGTVGSLNPSTMFINASSTIRKAAKSTGFTDQLVQITDYNNKLASGKNLNWNEIRGYAGGAAETAAYLAGGYYGGSAAGFWGGSSSAATSGGAIGSQSSYLGASTSFGGSGGGISSASQFGLSGSSVLTGSSAGSAASTGYLGANTTFGAASAGSGFLSKAGSFLGETAKTLGGAYVSAAIQGQRTPSYVGVEGGGSESFQPVYGPNGEVIQGGMDFQNFIPIIVIGGLIFAGIAAFKG